MESKVNVIVDPGIFMYIRIELLRAESTILKAVPLSALTKAEKILTKLGHVFKLPCL